jgi:hypothetical protein
MGGDEDTQLLRTSLGEMALQWAWNKWVAVTVPGARTVRAQVDGRNGLAQLFVNAGLPSDEADSVSREAWRRRPSSSVRRGEAEPWGNPWRRLRYGTLAVVLAGLMAMVLCFFWLKLDWVAV